MNIQKIVAVSGISLLPAGCITSLHPLHTGEDLIFDSYLLSTRIMVDPDTGKASEDSWLGTSIILGILAKGREEVT